ncbi:hypothetical protein SG26_03170 [Haloarcula sp. CBA1115]|nr:hypothetical protein SG26_03170 [Haloarcula sp. CBA1115]
MGNFIAIPKLFTWLRFCQIVSRLGTALAILGAIILVTGGIDLGLYELTPWKPNRLIMSSLLTNPNTFGFVMMIGTFAAIYEYTQTKHWQPIVLTIVGVSALYMSRARSPMLGLSVALGYLLVARVFNRTALPYIVIPHFVGIGLFLSAVLGILPLPSEFFLINFSGRLVIWDAAGQAIRDSSFFNLVVGQGYISPPDLLAEYIAPEQKVTGLHNAYLQMLVRFGIAGLLLHFTVYFLGSLHAVRSQNINIYPVTLVLGISVYILFESPLFFTPGITSVLQGLVLGYALKLDLAMSPHGN